MSDNYIQFAETIRNITKDEKEWILKTLDPDEGMFSDREGNIDFDWTLDQQRYLKIYSEESGNVENVAEFVQAFLEKFRPRAYFSLSWALTCSSSCPGEFGGGAMYVTANKVYWSNTTEWLLQKQRELDHIPLAVKVHRYTVRLYAGRPKTPQGLKSLRSRIKNIVDAGDIVAPITYKPMDSTHLNWTKINKE